MRKVLIGIVVLLVVLVAAAFIGPRFIPGDALKAQIAKQVQAATGRDLVIDGDLSFSLLPTPGVTVSGVRLSNVKGAQAADMVRLKSAQIAVALGPLIGGDIEIERVVLVEPVFELEQFANNVNNWTFAPSSGAASSAPVPPGTGSAAPARGPGTSIQLNDLVVRDGAVVFRSPDITERVEGINASFVAGSLNGPFEAEGEAVVRGVRTQLTAAIGALETDRAIPVSLSTSAASAKLTFSGLLSGFPNEPRIAGQLDGKAADLGALIAAVSGAAAPPALAGRPLAIKGDLSANRNAAALNNLSLGFAAVNASGAANVALGATPEADLVLNVGQLDLDKLLADFKPAPGKAGPPAARAAGTDAAGQSGAAGAAAPAAMFALPSAVNATVEARVEALVYRGGVIRNAGLIAQLAGGELTISQLSAQLPGSADMSLAGIVGARDGVPAFDGQAEINADNLRGLLSWLGIEVSAVPLDRLRKLALTANLDGTRDKFNITDIDLGIDGSRVRGGVAVALRERLGLGIGLSLDSFNFDAYFPPAAASPAPAEAAGQQPAAPAAREGAAKPGAATGLAMLGRFDSVLQLKAGTLTYRGKSIEGVTIDGTLAGGTLDLREASVKSLAGARAKASGRISGVAGAAPSVELNVDISASEADRLLEMLGAEPSFSVGPGRLQGAVKGDLDALDLNLTVAALDAQLATKGKVTALTGETGFDLALDLSHGDAAALLARVDGNGKASSGRRRADPLHVSAAVKGTLAKSAINAGITVGAGQLAVQGKLSDAGNARMSGGAKLTAEHPDLADAVRLFSPGYKPALAKPGALKFSTDLAFDPTTVRVDNLKGNAGPVAFESDATVALGGKRPRLVGDLRTSEIIVDWFLPVQRKAVPAAGGAAAPAGAAGQAARPAPGGERWSNERIDISALSAVDAEIAMAAPSITYTDLKVDQPKIKLRLADGVLDLGELSGRAYGGAFNMSGQLADKKVPTLRYVLGIDGADAAQFTRATGQQGRGVMSVLDLLFPVSSVRLVSGTLGAKIDVAAQGRSERELIGALSGTGSVAFDNAVAEGIDVCRISNQLGHLNGLEGFLGLALSAQGGQTRIANYAGHFDITRGIATLPQQRINADCATVDIRGDVDLPRWLVALQARALFPEHPKFPGVVVEEKGPLDAPNTRLVNSNEVQQYLIGKSAESVIRKLVPGANQQPAQPSGSGGQSAPQPVEQLRGLFKDLLKKR